MMRHDLHTHTTYSDGGHSVPLQALLARAMDLEAVAFSDHYFPNQGMAASEDTFAAYLAEIEQAQRDSPGMLVLAGAEAQALDTTGRVTITEDVAERLEWVLCDLGGHSEGTLRNTPADKDVYRDNVMRTYLGMCDLDFIDVIAHPFNTGNTSPALLPADYPEAALRELAQKMAATETVFDVMNLQLFWFQRCGIEPAELTAQYAELVRLFAAEGVMFQVSSDDHRCGIGHTTWSRKVLGLAAVPSEQIVSLPYLRARTGR